MRIRALKGGRRALLAAGALAAGALAGCQTSSGTQFSQPGVARGDTRGPVSPAFAQIAAGQKLPAPMPGRSMPPGGTLTASGGMIEPGMPATAYPTAAGGPMVLGSGGMVYPVSYSSSGPMPIQPGAMIQPAMMPTQAAPMMTMPGPVMHHQGPATAGSNVMPAMSAMPASPMPQTLMLVNGPNGPQYIAVDSGTPTMSGTAMMPAPVTVMQPPANGPVLSAPPPMLTPMPPPPASTGTQTVVAMPEAAPTLAAPPPPSAVPMPSMPALPVPADMTPKSPEPLPTSVSSKPPTGPVLPAADSAGPSLGSFPAVPTTSVPRSAGPVVPAGAPSEDDFIPSAPAFSPALR